ncbi:eukaryotic translation initiation factor 3 subunit J [Anabrus simplex]|uniref:eukaryotic translation initiation factor 3 subunit J n=1 Tax=Anabrus simplex TaxID=316456 RepID=UPI0034DD4399
MDEEWDAEAKQLPVAPVVGANKWVGEDEEEDVKDNWEDDEEEEKKDVEKQEPAVKTVQPKKPKKIRAEKIEEKEQRELERRVKLEQTELTAAEKQAEKLLRQKLVEESDLRVAMETFGASESTGNGIDAMNPSSKEEFDELQEALTKKLNLYNKSSHFPTFAEELIRNICVNLSSHDLKKLKTTVENMFLEKTKQEKGDKVKKNKGKGKAKLKVEGENQTLDYFEYDDYDDFM